jgi:molybdopterin converting factor small subunit
MQSIFNFIVKPIAGRYDNKKKIDDKELILNTELQNHQYVSRNAIVIQTPKSLKTDIKKGDEVIIHHNIFRRFHDIKGEEKNSKSYYKEDMYFAWPDQVYMYKQNNKWIANDGYCFVKPICSKNKLSLDKEQPLMGVVKFLDNKTNYIKENDLIGFVPTSEFEFIIDNQRMYRVRIQSITIKYERQGNEKEYNPSWT